MMFTDKEEKRIKELFQLYQSELDQKESKENALLEVWGLMESRDKKLNDLYGYKAANVHSKKALLQQLHPEVIGYDIYRAIEFILLWEFPEKYNDFATPEEIRSGKDALTRLSKKVRTVGNSILNS